MKSSHLLVALLGIACTAVVWPATTVVAQESSQDQEFTGPDGVVPESPPPAVEESGSSDSDSDEVSGDEGTVDAELNPSLTEDLDDSAAESATSNEESVDESGDDDHSSFDEGGETPSDDVSTGEEEHDDDLDPVSTDEAADGGPQLIKKGIGAISDLLGSGTSDSEVTGEESDEHLARIHQLRQAAINNIERGRVAEAVKNINELITLKPYESAYHLALGLCFRQQGNYQASVKKYQDVLDLGGPASFVALLRAEVFATEGNREKVFEMLKDAAIGGRNIINDVHTLPLLTEFQNDTEFIKLALQLERFELSREPLRDPFTNPFPKLSGDDEDRKPAIARDDKPLPKPQQEKLLRDARKLYERIQFYIKLQDEDKAMASYLQLKSLVAKKNLLTVPRIKNEFEGLLRRMNDVEIEISGIRLRYYYNRAQEQLKQMRDVFSDGEYARVEALHAELEGLAREMVGTNERYKEVADKILERAGYWLERSRVRMEFESQKPEIQGIIISGNAKMTILNDRIVKQGESLDDFRVVKVESNRVTFRYKGEEIPLVFRRY